MRSIPVVVLAGVGLLMQAVSAAAQSPVAVVEDVKGNPAGIEFMDYVTAGKVIKLAPTDSIVLGYMKSCWRETITGGTVTVGAEQSTVDAGKVERAKVGCDAGKMQLTEQQASQSAAMVFRNAPRPGQATQPQITLYGLSPVVEINGAGTLTIERLDKRGEHQEVAVGAAQPPLRAGFYDFAKSNKALTPGGVYRASLGKHEIVFKVDAQAKPGSTPIVGRLLRFPAS